MDNNLLSSYDYIRNPSGTTTVPTASGGMDTLIQLAFEGLGRKQRDPKSPNYPADGLDPRLQKLINKSGIDIVSGYRDTAHQKELWQQALEKYGDPEIADNWVARPGTSHHEQGIAIDVAHDDIQQLLSWLGNHPKWDKRVYRPMSWEDWHFELRNP